MTPIQQLIQHSQKISPSEHSNEKPDATAQREDANKSAFSPSAACKHPLPHDSTALVPAAKMVCTASLASHTTPQASLSAVSDSLSLLELIAKRREQDIEEFLKREERTNTTKGMNEESFEAFQGWFKKLAAKVGHEKASCAGET